MIRSRRSGQEALCALLAPPAAARGSTRPSGAARTTARRAHTTALEPWAASTRRVSHRRRGPLAGGLPVTSCVDERDPPRWPQSRDTDELRSRYATRSSPSQSVAHTPASSERSRRPRARGRPAGRHASHGGCRLRLERDARPASTTSRSRGPNGAWFECAERVDQLESTQGAIHAAMSTSIRHARRAQPPASHSGARSRPNARARRRRQRSAVRTQQHAMWWTVRSGPGGAHGQSPSQARPLSWRAHQRKWPSSGPLPKHPAVANA